jgi:hypothetical protein
MIVSDDTPQTTDNIKEQQRREEKEWISGRTDLAPARDLEELEERWCQCLADPSRISARALSLQPLAALPFNRMS